MAKKTEITDSKTRPKTETGSSKKASEILWKRYVSAGDAKMYRDSPAARSAAAANQAIFSLFSKSPSR